ncbi:UDP-N-acetylmuramoyl-L-alanyl-D-glutamate--2,6-diaminopimelate ligase [Oligoflexia bacterium]|nr:UDP-N-acetylmuramoyl-L-alanyl-D-glutamate--2,6-diaminopimelate ligase [Oligoflexia bacterium]
MLNNTMDDRQNYFHLEELTAILGAQPINFDPAANAASITSVTDSSQRVSSGSIFVAYPGVKVDAHDFLLEAFQAGASAAVVSKAEKATGLPSKYPCLLVPSGRRAVSRLAALFAGEPSEKLLTIGITGTNGKTTICWLLYNLLGKLECPGIEIGTLGVQAQNIIDEVGQITTPSALEVQKSLKLAVDHNLKCAVIEASSHALAQHRVDDVQFDLGIFTNLTTDHLDYHLDMESYFVAKVKLFQAIAKVKHKAALTQQPLCRAVINVDCPYGRRMVDLVRELGLRCITFGEAAEAEVRISDLQQNLQESSVTIAFEGQQYTIASPLLGFHNASNICACFAASISLGYRAEEIAAQMQRLPCAPGRLEFCGNDDVAVFVDYAHTGDGLEHALSALKGLVKNNLWVIFGCGGNKDPRKRTGMARAASKLADKIVITSDNPKTEDPQKIIDEILSEGCQAYMIEMDRAVAIEKTMQQVEKGDVVLLAGKGHEDYQIIGTDVFHFSDKEEVLKLRDRGVF